MQSRCWLRVGADWEQDYDLFLVGEAVNSSERDAEVAPLNQSLTPGSRRQRGSSVGGGGVWRGAVLAAILWLPATRGFASYVRHIGRYNVMYGSIGAGIALLVWMYLMAVIAILGCELNAEYERLSTTEPAA